MVLERKPRRRRGPKRGAGRRASPAPDILRLFGHTGEAGGPARSTTLALFVRMEAAMSLSLRFCSSTSEKLAADCAPFLRTSTSVAFRLWRAGLGLLAVRGASPLASRL